MIKVRCGTTLDGFENADWPTELTCRPEIGDRVQSSGWANLRIVGITHTVSKKILDGGLCVYESFLILELNR